MDHFGRLKTEADGSSNVCSKMGGWMVFQVFTSICFGLKAEHSVAPICFNPTWAPISCFFDKIFAALQSFKLGLLAACMCCILLVASPPVYIA